MRRDPCAIGPTGGNDDPDRHSCWIPAALTSDSGRDPAFLMDTADQVVDVDDVGLQLDDAALAIDGE